MTLHYLLSFLFLALTALSTLRQPHWWIKMWDASRVHLAVLMGMLLGIGIVTFDYSQDLSIALTLLLSGGIIYHFRFIYPYTFFHQKEVADTTNRNNPIRFLTCNVRMSNEDYSKLLRTIHQHQPDIVLLTETNQKWLDALTTLKNYYPNTVFQPQENTYGIALYSKLPLEDAQVKFLVEKEVPSIHTLVRVKDQSIKLIGVHPRPPAPWTKEENKDIELIKVASLTNNDLLPCIVSGDLNDVCWSPITQAFKSISGMKDPRVGRGLYNTYNAFIPLFRYPVDHFFISKHFKLLKIKRLEKVGSDHFPVLIEVNLEE